MSKLYRSSVTGEYVTEEFAIMNPDTTVSETIAHRRHIVYLKGDWDWEGVYVDGNLASEGHSIEADDAFELGSAGPFTYEVRYIDQEWADEEGLSSLPLTLDEVRMR